MSKEMEKENIQKFITFIDLAYKFLFLTEASLGKLIESGNRHIVLSNKPTSEREYFEATKWSDFNIAIPTLFNFYHGLELVMKGLLSAHGKVISNHNLVDSLENIKSDTGYPEKIGLILEKYIDIEKVNPLFKSFLDSNSININDLYEFLRYPYNKNFNRSISYFNLKYKEVGGIPFYKEIIEDSEELRIIVGEYYSPFRDLALS